MPTDGRRVSPALLDATCDTLRRLGPRRFSLTAVADAAGVSRGTVHNALGSRDQAIKTARNHLAALFVEAMAAEVDKASTLAQQVAAAGALICAHRSQSDWVTASDIKENVTVLLLRDSGDDLAQRAVQMWKPLVKDAQVSGEVHASVDPSRAAEWIVRILFTLELLPPMGVNLDNPRAVRRFLSDHIVNGLTGGSSD